MPEQKIIQKIEVLKSVRPSPVWKDFCRSWLEERLEIETKILNYSANDKDEFRFYNLISNLRFIFRPLAITASFLIFGVMSLLSLGLISQSALPGDAFFPVKVVFEKTRLALSPVESKAKLQIEITDNRFQELARLIEESKSENETAKAKKASLVQATQNLHQELTVMKKQLNKLPVYASLMESLPQSLIESEEELSPIETLQMAQEILENIEKTRQELNQGN